MIYIVYCIPRSYTARGSSVGNLCKTVYKAPYYNFSAMLISSSKMVDIQPRVIRDHRNSDSKKYTREIIQYCKTLISLTSNGRGDGQEYKEGSQGQEFLQATSGWGSDVLGELLSIGAPRKQGDRERCSSMAIKKKGTFRKLIFCFESPSLARVISFGSKGIAKKFQFKSASDLVFSVYENVRMRSLMHHHTSRHRVPVIAMPFTLVLPWTRLLLKITSKIVNIVAKISST